MRRIVPLLFFCGLLLVPTIAGAAWLPLVPCGGEGQSPCTPCHLFETVKNVIDFVLYGITGPIAAFMIVWAGGLMLLGGGNPKLFGQGKAMLTQTLIGVTIILMAWVITNFLVKSLISGGQGDTWYEFTCPAGLSVIKPLETAMPTNGKLPNIPEATILVPKNLGVAAAWTNGSGSSSGGAGGGSGGSGGSGQALGLCATGKCSGGCPKLAPILNGRANAKILEAIMVNESSCNVDTVGPTGDYGLMQMKPETANRFREGCEVTQTTTTNGQKTEVPVQITAAWLMAEENVEKSVCVADNYINSLKGACGSDPYHLAGGYNGGAGVCALSRDCADIDSCSGGGKMRRWECPWDDKEHTIKNTGYEPTRKYAPKVAACAR